MNDIIKGRATFEVEDHFSISKFGKPAPGITGFLVFVILAVIAGSTGTAFFIVGASAEISAPQSPV